MKFYHIIVNNKDIMSGTNKLHEYHRVMNKYGQIDQTDWRICTCRYCSVWTPDVLASYDEYILYEKEILENTKLLSKKRKYDE